MLQVQIYAGKHLLVRQRLLGAYIYMHMREDYRRSTLILSA